MTLVYGTLDDDSRQYDTIQNLHVCCASYTVSDRAPVRYKGLARVYGESEQMMAVIGVASCGAWGTFPQELALVHQFSSSVVEQYSLYDSELECVL